MWNYIDVGLFVLFVIVLAVLIDWRARKRETRILRKVGNSTRILLDAMEQESNNDVVHNIRDLVGHYIGARLLDITQGEMDSDESRPIYLHFDNNLTLTFYIGENIGFWYESNLKKKRE